MKKIILLLIATFLFADTVVNFESGRLKVFVFIDGKPIQNTEVILQNVGKKVTDSDGLAVFVTSPRDYSVRLKSEEYPQINSYEVKTQVMPNEETQLIIDFKKGDKTARALEDIAKFQVEDVKTQEEIEAEKNLKKGKLLGHVINTEDKSPIVGARVFVKGSPLEAITDDKGNFMLEILEGTRAISIIHNDYSTRTIEGIDILPEGETKKEITMTPAGVEMDEFVVLAPHIEGGVAALVDEKKNSDVVSDILGSEQMSKQGDSNAAAALKRVAGLTLIGGKDIYVRGLGDRYASVELNNMPLPSPNPLKRVVPLDVFPAGVIGSLQVQKTFSPDIPGTFGGGYINIRTKGTSSDEYVKFSTGINGHSSLGSENYAYTGGTLDFLGIDNYRAMSDDLIELGTLETGVRNESVSSLSSSEQKALKEALAERTLKVVNSTVPIGGSASLEVAKNFAFGEHKISVLGNYAYSQSSNNVERLYNRYEVAVSATGELEDTPTSTYTQNISQTKVQHGGILNVTYSYEDLVAKYTKFYVYNTILQTRYAEGTFGANSTEQKKYNLEWEERTLSTDQLTSSLKYFFITDMKLDLGYEFATAKQYQPNNISYLYTNTINGYELSSSYGNVEFENVLSEDYLHSYYIKNKIETPFFNEKDYIEIGFSQEIKNRAAATIRYGIQENISDTSITTDEIDVILSNYDDLSLILLSGAQDKYDASLNRIGGYAKTTLRPFDNFELSGGIRYSSVSQTITRYAIANNILTEDPRDLNVERFLPTVGLKYSFNDDNQIRFAYYQSYIIPDFREFIPTTFKHPTQNALISGNEDLIETDIQSFDVRYEYYFNGIDNITFAYFYKYMENPIEDTQILSSSGLTRYTYDNSKSATINGIELSWSKGLGFIFDFLEDVSFGGNYTYLVSDVVLTDEQKETYVTQDRELQGLSPQILNLSIQYDAIDNRSLSLAYNHMSERLMKVAIKNGTTILGDDDYEIPADTLDFVWQEKFPNSFFNGKSELKFKWGNILDGTTEWQQQGKTTYSYKKGQNISLTFSHKY